MLLKGHVQGEALHMLLICSSDSVLFGTVPMLVTVVYVLVGAAALYLAFMEWPKYLKK